MSDNTSGWMDFAQRSRDEGGLGLAPHQAAGLVGNLQNESGSDIPAWGPTGDNGSAWGSAQWRGDRLDGLKQSAADSGLDYRSPEAQQAWMRHEFDTTHSGAYKALQATTTPEDAANVVNRQYEISADRSGRREQSARALMAGPTAIETAMGRKPATGSQAMAYQDPGALTNPGQPQGALTSGGQPVAAQPSWLSTLGDALMNMAPGIAQDPENKRALAAVAAAQVKPATQGTWSTNFDPKTGIATQTHSIDGSTRQFKYATPTKDDKKWGVIQAADPIKGTPTIQGYLPTQDEWEAQQAAKAAAPPSTAPDPSTLTGKDFMDSLTANRGSQYANSVQAIVDGRALMPTASSRQPGAAQLRADALQADPTLQEGTGPARVKLRQAYETSTAPNSPASLIKVAGTAMQHGGTLSDAIEGFKSYSDHHDSAIPYVSYGLNYANNSMLAGQSTPEAQAYAAAIKERENYGDEVAKFYGGGPAGEMAKKRAIEALDFSKSLPELRAILAGDAEMIRGKANTLQDAWRTGNDNSKLVPDFPVISKDSQAAVDKINSRYELTKSGGYTGPSGKPPAASSTGKAQTFKSPQGVSWSIN